MLVQFFALGFLGNPNIVQPSWDIVALPNQQTRLTGGQSQNSTGLGGGLVQCVTRLRGARGKTTLGVSNSLTKAVP